MSNKNEIEYVELRNFLAFIKNLLRDDRIRLLTNSTLEKDENKKYVMMNFKYIKHMKVEEILYNLTENDCISILKNLDQQFKFLIVPLLEKLSPENVVNVLKEKLDYVYSIENSGNNYLKYVVLNDASLVKKLSVDTVYNLYDTLGEKKKYLLSNLNILEQCFYNYYKHAIYNYLKNYKRLKDDNINKNILYRVSCKTLYKIFKYVKKRDLNKEMVLSILNSMHFSISKAIYFVNCLEEISDEDKVDILKEIYPDFFNPNICYSIEMINGVLQEQILNEVSNNTVLDGDFMDIIPDVINDSYNYKLLSALVEKYNCSLGHRQIFLSQVFAYEKEQKKLDLTIEFINNYICNYGGAYTADRHIHLNLNYHGNIINKIVAVFHELRHAYQAQNTQDISYKNLFFCIDKILSVNLNKYYLTNYDYISYEVDAITYSLVATYKFLNRFMPNYEYDLEKYKEKFKCKMDFFKNIQFVISSSDNFIPKLVYFFDNINSFDMIKIRKKYKLIELITNDDGLPYTFDEIASKIDKLNTMTLNDKLKKQLNFYKRYLYNYSANFDIEKQQKCKKITNI